MKPLVGLPGRRRLGHAVAGVPDNFGAVPFDVYHADFARCLLAAGAIPVHLPVDVPATDAMDRLDGLLLPGGPDIDPGLYGAASQTDLFPPEPDRDVAELALVSAAFERDLPVLGVCRGLQLLNVHGGGSLHQHVPEHSRFDSAPTFEAHRVRIEPDSALAAIFGHEHTVNSLHHQTVDRLAAGYSVTALADDGTVEGIERDEHVLAVQWHPELMVGADLDPLFGWLVERARNPAS